MAVMDNIDNIGGKNTYSQISPTDISNTTFTQSGLSCAIASKSGAVFTMTSNGGAQLGYATFTSDDYFEIDFNKTTYCTISVTNYTSSGATFTIKGSINLIDESGVVTELVNSSTFTWTTSNSSTITTIRDITSLGLSSGKYKLQLKLNNMGNSTSNLAFVNYGIMFV